MSWLLYVPYVAVVFPTALILLQILCNGHFSIDKSFTFIETSPHDGRIVQDGYVRDVIKISVPDCPYESVLHSWFVLPEKAKPNKKLPIIVMSHGIGAQKDMGLMNYAKVFANAGYAVLIFDYRYFGGSYTMKPVLWRNFIYPWNHKKDITVVVDFIKKGLLGAQVDAEQIVLWGTSMAGGHVLTAAHALKPNAIRGVISQVAHLDGIAATQCAIKQRGVVGTIRVLSLALADFVMSQLLGFSPIYIKIAGNLNETAYMSLSDEDLKLYYSKHPTRYLGGWRNLAPARTAGILSLYNPKTVVRDIAAPVLFIAATKDTLCPVEPIRQAAEEVMDKANSAIVEIDCGHFDVYQGEAFTQGTAAMLAFLAKVVPLN